MKKFSLLTLTLLLLATVSFAQEVCNNGKDDDGDGFIDCFDKKCANNFACGGTYVGNDLLCEARPSQFPKFSLTLESASPDGSAMHLGRPVIGDIDGDGSPEMMTVNRWSKKIFILNGKATGGVNTIKKQITVDYRPAYEDIAIANLNNGNGNCGEIFVLSTGWTLRAYDCNLVELWATSLPGDPGTIGIADFNGDGVEEIYARNAIYNARTGAVIVAPPTDWGSFNGGPVAVDILNDATNDVHLLTDAVKDDNLELVVGGVIYSVNISAGTITKEKEITYYGKKVNIDATSIADFNLDGSLDVIASGKNTNDDNSTIFFWDLVTDKIKTFSDPDPATFTINACPTSSGTYYKNGWHQGTGRVNIADLDGDGYPNLAFVSGKYLYALKDNPANAANLETLWPKVTVNEETSGNTGCTLFDFNGDGKSEIVYRDEKFIYIINGTDGSIFTQQTCVSRTNREYPIVADVDADGQTELCVTCRTVDFFPNTTSDPDPNYSDNANFCNLDNAEFSQVRVYKSGGEPWVPARRVWNQHGYFNVNVNDDLTIPKIQQKHHLVFSENVCTTGKNRPLNGFLNQSPYLNSLGCPKYASPDLAFVPNSLEVNAPTCPEKNFTISFKFKNQGDVGLSGTLPITFYNGNPTLTGAIKLNTVQIALADLKVGGVLPVSNATVNGPGSPFHLYIVLNDGGTTVPTPIKLPNTNFIECNYTNNILDAAVDPDPVPITAEKLKDNIICGTGTPDNGAAHAYVQTGAVKNTADYYFYWTMGPVAKAIPADSVGPAITQVPDGEYAVFAIHKTVNCSSDTAVVNIDDIQSIFTVKIDTISGLTNCKDNKNGHLKARVFDADGKELSEDDANGRFNFKWYEGNDYEVGLLQSSSFNISGINVGVYTVGVVEKATGCLVIESASVPDATVQPMIDPRTEDITCSASDKGRTFIFNPVSGYTYHWSKGKAAKPVADFEGAEYVNLDSGSYTVVGVVNATKCASDTITVKIKQTTPPVITGITKNSDQISCAPNVFMGSATVTVQGNVNDYHYQWYKGQTTAAANAVSGKTSATATGLEATIYTVKVTDKVTSCFSTREITFNGPSAVALGNIASTDQTTCVPNNSRIEVQLMASGSGAVSDYDFFWYKGTSEKTTPDFPSNKTNVLSGVEPGDYTVKAVHKITKCATPSRTIKVGINLPAINASLSNQLPPTDCALPTGFLEVTVTSPSTSGYDFAWYNGGTASGTPITSIATDITTNTSSRKTELKQGNYTVQVTNRDTGCKKEAQYKLVQVNSHTIDTISTARIVNCIPAQGGGMTVEIGNLAPGLSDVDYDIFLFQQSSDPGGTSPLTLTSNGTVNQFNSTNPLNPEYYTIVAVAKTGATQGCRASMTVPIKISTTDPVIDGDLTAASIINNSYCKTENIVNAGNGSISLELVVPPGYDLNNDYDIQWSNGDTDLLNGNLKPGEYNVKVTYNGNAPQNQGCYTEKSFTVLNDEMQMTVNLADGDLDPDDIIACDLLTGQPLATSGSATFTQIVINRGQTDETLITDFSNYTFDWRKEDGSSVTDSDGNGDGWDRLSVLNAGNYYVTAMDNTSHCDITSSFTVYDKTINAVEVTLNDFTVPTQCLVPDDVGELIVTAAGGGLATTYAISWFEGQTVSGDPLGTTTGTVTGANNNTATDLIAGYYSVLVRNNDNNCTVSDVYQLPLDVYPVEVIATAAPLTVCFTSNQDGQLTAVTTNAHPNAYTFDWYTLNPNTGATQLMYANTKEVQHVNHGQYIVMVTEKTDPACIARATVTVDDLRAYPTVVATGIAPLTNCDPTRPNGVAEATVNGQFINHTFNWYAGPAVSGSAFYTGSQVSGLAAQTYSVVAIDFFTGCSDSTQVNIEMDQLPVPMPDIEILSMVTSCVEDNGSLAVSVGGNTADYTFHWYIGTTEKPSADYIGEYYDSLATGMYAATATSLITGCKSPVATEEIISEPVYPDFNFEIQATTCTVPVGGMPGQPSGAASIFITNGVLIDKIEWDINGTLIASPLITNLDAGIYSVTVTSQLGCASTKEIEVKTDIRVFNGISRNGDGANDIFNIGCIENFPTNLVKIFNRAGTLVYEAEGYDNIDIYFDGKSNKGLSMMGNNLPDGTYYYIVDKKDGSKPKAGYLEIVN